MRLTYERIQIHPKRSFKISVSTHDHFEATIVKLEHAGIVGYGEASPSKRVSGEDARSIGAFLDWAASEAADLAPARWDAFLDHMHADICAPDVPEDTSASSPRLRSNPGARCAVDLAMHDLVGKSQGVPARALYGLPEARLETSMTVSMDAPDVMAAEARGYREAGFRCLKLKLGDPSLDISRVEAVRKACPDARIRADANTAWTLDEGLPLTRDLARLGVEFVEQPLPPGDVAALVEFSQQSAIPLYADESVHDALDVERLAAAGFVGGMNVKLVKAGGIRPAFAALVAAKRAGYPCQLGCNVETSVGIAGALQLLSLLDHADLDGNVLLRDDPFEGIEPHDGRLETPEAPGLGVQVRRV